MNSFGKCAMLSILMMTAWPLIVAQELDVSVDRQQCAINETISLTITLRDGTADRLDLPNLKPFEIVGGPHVKLQSTMVNGRWSSSRSWTYLLKAPTTEGTYQIPSITILEGKRKLQSNPIKVRVTSRAAEQIISPSNNDEVQLYIEVSTKEAYIGQMIVLRAYILTKKDIGSIEVTKYPIVSHAYTVEMNANVTSEIVQLQGKKWLKKYLYQLGIFPQISGQLEISPMEILCYPIEQINDPIFGPFSFFKSYGEPIPVKSDPMKINILTLPYPSPEHFTGATGEFTLEIEPVPDTLWLNQSIKIKTNIIGSGDPKLVNPPTLILNEIIEIYNIANTNEEILQKGTQLISSKSYEYLLAPKDTGKVTLTMPFVFFNTEDKMYQTIEWKHSLYILPSKQTVLSEYPDQVSTINREKSSFSLLINSAFILLALSLLGLTSWIVFQRKSKNTSNKIKVHDLKIDTDYSPRQLYIMGKYPEMYHCIQNSILHLCAPLLEKNQNLIDQVEIRELIIKNITEDENKQTSLECLKNIQWALYAGIVKPETAEKDLYCFENIILPVLEQINREKPTI